MESNQVEVVFRLGETTEKAYQEQLLALVKEGCRYHHSAVILDQRGTTRQVTIVFKRPDSS